MSVVTATRALRFAGVCLLASFPSAGWAGWQDVYPFVDVSPSLRNLGCANSLRALHPALKNASDEEIALLWKRAQSQATRKFIHVKTGEPADLASPFTAAFDESLNYALYVIPAGAEPDQSIN